MNYRNKWDKRFMDLAEHISTWSKDPSSKVGAVLVNDRGHVVSVGYNGFAHGVMDLPERLNNREEKYRYVVHAEVNAVLSADRPVRGCTLYTWPFQPCSPCAGIVIQSGIVEVVAPTCDNERWAADFARTVQQFEEAGVSLRLL